MCYPGPVRQRQRLGLAFAVASMVTYGFLPVCAHHFSRVMDGLLFAGVGSLLGAAALLAKLASEGHVGALRDERFARPLAAVGLLGILATMLLFTGTKLTSGLNTSLLLQVEPFYSVTIAALLLGERTSRAELASTALMVLGAGVVVYRGAEGLNAGDALILMAPLCQQLSHVVTKGIIARVPTVTLIPAARLLWSGVGLTCLALASNPGSVKALSSPSAWLGMAAFGLLFRALDNQLWYEAISRIPLGRASAVIPVSVAVSTMSAVFLLGERMDARQAAGLAVIGAGLGWFSYLHWTQAEA